MANPWKGLEGPGYRIQNLGRPAVFLIPTYKLRKTMIGARSAEEDLHAFLSERFGAFTTTTVPFSGYWKDATERLVADDCRMYEVSFVGKDRIPELLTKLGEICAAIEEDCLYVKAGQYSALLYPAGSAAVTGPKRMPTANEVAAAMRRLPPREELRIRSPRVVRKIGRRRSRKKPRTS